MDKIELLKKFGLSKPEILTYFALLENGPLLISNICKKTKLHRPTVYQAIDGLLKRALISTSPKGRQKKYSAESPEKLEFIFESFRDDFNRLLPELKEDYVNQKKRPVIKFVEGSRGIAYVMEDFLHSVKRGGISYRYSPKNVAERMDKYLPPKFRERRDAKNIERLTITDALTERQKMPDLNKSYKFVPKDSNFLGEDIIEIIYADKVAFGDLKNKNGVIIESSAFAQLQKNIFKALYKRLDSTPPENK